METPNEIVLKRFDRHAQMSQEQRKSILEAIELVYQAETYTKGHELTNCLFGMFDGYFYVTQINNAIEKLEELGYGNLAHKIKEIVAFIEKYEFIPACEN